MIEVNEITAGYESKPVIHDISFSVGKRALYVLLGPNGAGKTTTFRVITGILPPIKGRVLVNSVDLWSKPEEAKRYIGYLPEGDRLYPDLTVEDNLKIFGKIYRVSKSGILRSLELLGVDDLKDVKVKKLSAGLRKRVALARAVMHNPDVLVLDEPFANLDVESVDNLRKIIIDFVKDKVVVLSTHRVSELSYFEEVNSYLGIIVNGRLRINTRLINAVRLVKKPLVVLKVSDVELSKKVLERTNVEFTLKENMIIVQVPRYDDISSIVELLVESGIRVYEVRPAEQPIETLLKVLSKEV